MLTADGITLRRDLEVTMFQTLFTMSAYSFLILDTTHSYLRTLLLVE